MRRAMEKRRREGFSGGGRRRVAVKVYFAVALVVSVPGACAKKQQRQTGYEDVLIKDVPHVRQRADFCGEACADMYLRKLGSDVDQDYVFEMSGVDPVKGRGCVTAELVRALKEIGFEVGEVWYRFAADKAEAEMEEQFEALHADLVRGIPSIVCMRYDDKRGAKEHFRLVVGYDSKTDAVVYHEPARARGAYRRMKREKFFELWPLRHKKDWWTLIRIRLEAGKIKKRERIVGFSNADYAQHMIGLKDRIPDSNFTVVLQKPFVVIGDEPAAVVRRRSVRTVKWAVDRLKQDYFEKDPVDIIDIWLFKDGKSYERNTRRIFGEVPHTPFGYFSDENNALIMNIGTGGGTLVHEIVHPFVHSNFPECPAWFNEGLASLYEQCSEKNGRIHGLTNWRLAGLQKDIRAGKIGTFEALTGAGEHKFYGGDNYAQARYLCYYLQEKGLLVKFYHEFCAGRAEDPTGFGTLKRVLGEDDMDAFQKRWEEFVLGLTFP